MILADRARRWIRFRLERWLGRFAEGPEPPTRLRDMVHTFANINPHATRAEWVDFAAEFAGEVWRTAYQAGFEYVERDNDFFRDQDPDAIADAHDPDWRDGPPVVLEGDPTFVVPDEEPAQLEDLLVPFESGKQAWDVTID